MMKSILMNLLCFSYRWKTRIFGLLTSVGWDWYSNEDANSLFTSDVMRYHLLSHFLYISSAALIISASLLFYLDVRVDVHVKLEITQLDIRLESYCNSYVYFFETRGSHSGYNNLVWIIEATCMDETNKSFFHCSTMKGTTCRNSMQYGVANYWHTACMQEIGRIRVKNPSSVNKMKKRKENTLAAYIRLP